MENYGKIVDEKCQMKSGITRVEAEYLFFPQGCTTKCKKCQIKSGITRVEAETLFFPKGVQLSAA